MTERTKLILAGGLAAGLIGYAAVVVVVGAINVLMGRSLFHTAAMFGAAMFYGLEDPAALQISAGPVLAYNMVHVLTLLAVGLFASWLVSLAEEYPAAQYFILVALVFVAFHLFAALLLFAGPLLGGSAWIVVLVGGMAAAVAMGWYLLKTHPLLQKELREIPMGEVPTE
ncbi:MAG: hypothetical protein JSW51_08005 [Gemmatimonadota bacterium]|nr:MAG: hypothetical protein JSW51_08005 [Gemmatimonadota bacterium]